jgi:hypothetical protein
VTCTGLFYLSIFRKLLFILSQIIIMLHHFHCVSDWEEIFCAKVAQGAWMGKLLSVGFDTSS